MSLAGTLGGNTSDQARPFEKGAGFLVPLEPVPKSKRHTEEKESVKEKKKNDSI